MIATTQIFGAMLEIGDNESQFFSTFSGDFFLTELRFYLLSQASYKENSSICLHY